MLIFGILAICIHLFAVVHISNSLVLLTANLEDIKKIARQFVSESVADQIGKFLVQTSANRTVNISEENNLNDDVHKVSDDEWEVPRANRSSTEDVEKILKDAMERVKKMQDVVHDVTKDKPKIPEIFNEIQKDVNVKTTTKKKNTDYYTYDFILTPEKTKKPKYEWKKGLNFDFLSTRNVNKQKVLYDSFTRGAMSDKDYDSDVNKIENISTDHEDRRAENTFKRLEPNIQRLINVKSHTDATVTSKHQEVMSTRLRAEENTTETNILDYNDNSIYIRKEIIATSGPIDLFKATAVKGTSTSSEDYSLKNGIKDKKDINDIDLYFRKLLDSKIKLYKNNTNGIQIENAVNKTNKPYGYNKTTKERVVLKKVQNANNTLQHKHRGMKEDTTVKDISYIDVDNFYY